MSRAVHISSAAILAALLVLVNALALGQNKPRIMGPMPAKDGETCVVCNSRVSRHDLAYVIDGQRMAVMRAMEADLLANPLEYVTKFRPEGMIFSNQQSQRESGAYFWAGVLVLIGLIFGGACAHMAMGKGFSAWRWFALGFVFSVPAALVLAMKAPAPDSQPMPEGLAKMPLTHGPIGCTGCGAANHPSAAACSSCGGALEPSVTSEVEAAKK
ncbi:MAG: hypothetical protein R2729_32680 [Bryobacteraceae bacterium]